MSITFNSASKGNHGNLVFVLQVDTEDVFLVTASMNNETVFSAEINLNGKCDLSVKGACT